MPIREGCLEDGISQLQPEQVKRRLSPDELYLLIHTWNPLEAAVTTCVIDPVGPGSLTRLPDHVHLLFESVPAHWRKWAKANKLPVEKAGGLTEDYLKALFRKARIGPARQDLLLRYLMDSALGQRCRYVPKSSLQELLAYLRIDQQGVSAITEGALNLTGRTDAEVLLNQIGTSDALRTVAAAYKDDLHALHQYIGKALEGRLDPLSVQRFTRLSFLYDAVYERGLMSHRVAWLRFLYESCSPSTPKTP